MKNKYINNYKPESHPLTWRINNNQETIFLNEYIKKDGYKALKKTLMTMNATDVIKLITIAGLKGRGGGGFPTGIKWNLMPKKQHTNEIRYFICNADEMEPGTYKDRFLIESLPHQLIEGMIISAFAIQANKGYIFLRGEYIKCANILNQAIKEAYNFGVLGHNIFNTDFNFELFLHTGAGRYICGEETALLNSLEGKRANPRFKPPYPSTIGLWGKPTCINNVETICNINGIILHGAQWYKDISHSTHDSGTKLFGFSGNVNNPGLWELPFGTKAYIILEKYAHGMKKGFTLKTWQPGGAGTGFLLPKHLDLPMDFINISNIGSRLGTGIAMAVDHKINIISLLKNIESFFARESCGLCTPCREGLPWIVQILNLLEKKQAHMKDITLLKDISNQLINGRSFCSYAPGAIEPLQSALKYFTNEFYQGIKNNV
ncbi:NADH-quinone oxidoreductase subunit NuoF [Enterobacteriaceae endosymbiont of Neohaemonia nigricornis]|uniref:NADH-quinone oxidoreductase subunit NuoF n=1 Tax=Enterobacteriaceae endosymbiont of Neohaemonia nigricornis TaxID=2675792 RepID=UPI0014497140|nr:NADH-quinone oxidoreductase subunit NuoF [Enterobacteriaceae endosymbiont of Neohaemonia nigricornis]QJC30550.1 NADH-quinone oxidoreductase subunit NuoF [Enterobacteriaceae endosymbiont of Neohaemonia nigricornis]